MAEASAAELLKAQLTNAWALSRLALDGLDADEWGWEPAATCWSVRPRDEAATGWGREGDFVCEDGWPPPDPVPVTTISWRVAHLAAWTDIYTDFTFGEATLGLPDLHAPADVVGGLRWLFEAQDRFIAAVETLDDESAFELRPVHWGVNLPVAHIVTSMLTEHVHHIAEIGALRDVKRGRARRQPPPPPSVGPQWWTG